jgi:methyl-accepting chemotaxis protein
MKLTVRNKLFIGFGMVLAIMFIVSVNTYYQLGQNAAIQDRVINLRQPTVEAGMQLTNGINLSLAGLRGYMILGAEPAKATIFKAERVRGWEEIDSALAQFRKFSKGWTVSANVQNLHNMEALVEEFRTAQQEIENISHTDANIPAVHMLITEAAPRASKVLTAITALIDEESTLPATPERKKLLKLMADSRGSFAIGLASIRAYLLSGDNQFKEAFEAKWQVNQTRAVEIETMAALLSPTQHKAWQQYQAIRQEFAPLPPKMFELRASAEWNLANYWLGSKAAPKARAIMDILKEMRASQNKLSAEDTALLAEKSSMMKIIIVVASLLALLVGAIIATMISRMITIPLSKSVAYAKILATGDLTTPPLQSSGNDELSELTDAMNELSNKLGNVIQQVHSSTAILSAAAVQLTGTAELTDQGMAKQQIEIEQVATAMNEMTATVQEVAQNASEAALSTAQADKETASGSTLVKQNRDSIHRLAQRIEQATVTINKLGEETQGVDEVVGVINGIAGQTNLLALNAAIEAARAGEQGRGFAVVADEVRTLASRTQQSTVEIRAMLDRLKAGAVEAVKVMEEGHKQAQESVDSANAATASLAAISKAVATINDMNTQIATASEEQSAVAEEMNRSIVQISTEAETTAHSARETGSAAAQVNELAAVLQELVANFKVELRGK